MYGIAKDYKSEVGPYMPVRTRISNFIMTGQSIGVHGIMGVAMNSIIASSVLIDVNQLIREIREAN
jgi:all-trans-retinol 13,14-reductase